MFAYLFLAIGVILVLDGQVAGLLLIGVFVYIVAVEKIADKVNNGTRNKRKGFDQEPAQADSKALPVSMDYREPEES